MNNDHRTMCFYPPLDPEELGDLYQQHVEHMTTEKLHYKSDIAAQLAHRDMLLADAQRRLQRADMGVTMVHELGKAVQEAGVALGLSGGTTLTTAIAPEIMKLRRLLAMQFSGIYWDDGEMQDNTVLPFIDFKRDSVDVIIGKLQERAGNEIRKNLEQRGSALLKPLDEPSPIDMVLHCPACGVQHIDAPGDPRECDGGERTIYMWQNPPHRSHLCLGCGFIWRPADVPTNGVKAVKTRGKADSALPEDLV